MRCMCGAILPLSPARPIGRHTHAERCVACRYTPGMCLPCAASWWPRVWSRRLGGLRVVSGGWWWLGVVWWRRECAGCVGRAGAGLEGGTPRPPHPPIPRGCRCACLRTRAGRRRVSGAVWRLRGCDSPLAGRISPSPTLLPMGKWHVWRRCGEGPEKEGCPAGCRAAQRMGHATLSVVLSVPMPQQPCGCAAWVVAAAGEGAARPWGGRRCSALLLL